MCDFIHSKRFFALEIEVTSSSEKVISNFASASVIRFNCAKESQFS
jgi:hypothetical protein